MSDFEQVPMTVYDIMDLRGSTLPVNCDWCGKSIEEVEDLMPEEAQSWVCRACWDRAEEEYR